jgi:hypothetical protein
MFHCKKCEIYKAEVAYLREMNKSLQDRLMALADAKAYGAVSAPLFTEDPKGYFGTDDEVVEYNEYGQKITVKI